MNALNRIRDLFDSGPLLDADKPAWAAARTLHDLCELTAQWLEGRIQSQPGYFGPVDVDEAPYLREALIALNRAGFLTYGSQEGYEPSHGPAPAGGEWYQLASVTGFAARDTVDWLTRALDGTPYEVFAHPCKTSRWWRRALPGVTVTWWDGRRHTRFGHQMGEATIAGCYSGCSDAAVDVVCAALQVTIYDSTPGPNDLWPTLAAAVATEVRS